MTHKKWIFINCHNGVGLTKPYGRPTTKSDHGQHQIISADDGTTRPRNKICGELHDRNYPNILELFHLLH